MKPTNVTNIQREGLRNIAPAEKAEYSVEHSDDLTSVGPAFRAQQSNGAKSHPHLAGKPVFDGAPDSKKPSLPTQMSDAEINKAASSHDLTLAPGLTLEYQPTNAPTPSAAPTA